jgi:hypothetical protein
MAGSREILAHRGGLPLPVAHHDAAEITQC